MESRAHALATGIFTVLLGIAAALAVWWLSGKREATAEYMLVSSKSLTGLNPQATVRFRGVRAGKVEDIRVDPQDRRNILVRITIAEGFPIMKSTTARLNYQGVTGIAYVQLDDDGSSNQPLTAPEGELARIPLQPSDIESLAESAQEMLQRSRVLIDRVNNLLSDQTVAHINRTVANLDAATAGLGDTIKAAPEVIAALKQVVSESNIRRLQAILANLERTSGEAAPLAADLRQLVSSLQAASKRVETLGNQAGAELVGTTLPRIDMLVQDLSGTSRHLSRLLQELEGSPQALIFGRAAPRPGPGEKGFDPSR